jgi:hypothetical protein
MEYYDTILVSEQRLKEYTGLDENIRVEDITSYILNAQDIYLQNILGTKFFNRLKDGVREDDLTNDEFELLQDYVSKPLMHYSLYLMMPNIKYKIVNKGILNGASEDTTTTTLEELKYLRQSTLDTAEFYAKRLVEHLKDYPGKFAEYEVPGVFGMKPDKKTPYFSGLVTKEPRKRYKNDCDDCDPLYGPSSYTNPY